MGNKADFLREKFWEDDKKNGGLIYNQYIEIKRVLQNKDKSWVENKLKTIKQHAINQTEFYKNYDVEADFPVVNKTILNENKELFTAKEGYLTPLHISSTSGSTGTPFSVTQDLKKRKRNIADLKVFGELCDYPSHERMVFFRVINSKLHRTPEQENQENIYYVDSSNLDDFHLQQMVNILKEKNPRIIFSYSSTLVELGKFIQRTNEHIYIQGLTSLLTAGEGISEEDRLMLEKVFHCKLYRRYSDMELGILGQDNGDGGKYYLNWGSYYFECLKLDSDEPAEMGEVGRIVITDLFNRAFPLIRYDTGDLGVMNVDSDEDFPYYSEIFGRKRDCVYATNGSLVSPAKISVSMWGVKGVKQWQFIQEDKNEYLIKINIDGNVDTDSIIKKYKEILGKDSNIKIKFVDEIPVVSSNKRRAIICNYKKA